MQYWTHNICFHFSASVQESLEKHFDAKSIPIKPSNTFVDRIAVSTTLPLNDTVALSFSLGVGWYGNPELYDPTDTCRPTRYRHTCPTISSFFTIIYTDLKCPIHSFEFPYICMTYTIPQSRFNTQTSMRTCQ